MLPITACTNPNVSVPVPERGENFKNEYFKNFSDVKNLVYFLGKESSDVLILFEDERNLVFAFTYDFSSDEILDYLNELKLQGFEVVSARDATISSSAVYVIPVSFSMRSAANANNRISSLHQRPY